MGKSIRSKVKRHFRSINRAEQAPRVRRAQEKMCVNLGSMDASELSPDPAEDLDHLEAGRSNVRERFSFAAGIAQPQRGPDVTLGRLAISERAAGRGEKQATERGTQLENGTLHGDARRTALAGDYELDEGQKKQVAMTTRQKQRQHSRNKISKKKQKGQFRKF